MNFNLPFTKEVNYDGGRKTTIVETRRSFRKDGGSFEEVNGMVYATHYRHSYHFIKSVKEVN